MAGSVNNATQAQTAISNPFQERLNNQVQNPAGKADSSQNAQKSRQTEEAQALQKSEDSQKQLAAKSQNESGSVRGAGGAGEQSRGSVVDITV